MATTPFDPARVREDFPILSTMVRDKPLCYLDNAASTQKPRAVIDRLEKYYSTENANIHRGVHHLGELATDAYHGARKTVAEVPLTGLSITGEATGVGECSWSVCSDDAFSPFPANKVTRPAPRQVEIPPVPSTR